MDFALAVSLAQKAAQPTMTKEELEEFLKEITASATAELHGKSMEKFFLYRKSSRKYGTTYGDTINYRGWNAREK
ncbi:MAG TPA: hypothetical protein VK071_09095 [Tissierellales bacterium]|nr:hypothetical protein [Tissierellales bacterium]